MKFSSHGRKYELTETGAIHQLDAKPFVYDAKYSSTYDTPEYTKQSDKLMAMRLGFVMAAHGNRVNSLLDFGYGNGAFMKAAAESIRTVEGFDVTGVKVDGFRTFTDHPTHRCYDVMTFWDALEHLPDFNLLHQLCTGTLVISLPYCHARKEGLDWFSENYKHRKPDEHLWHFDEVALEHTLKQYGWKPVAVSTFEDTVRKSEHGLPNILTMAFRPQNSINP